MNASFPELEERLAALRSHAQAWSPPERVALAIAAAARNAGRQPSRLRRIAQHWIAWPLALAASVVIVALAVREWSDRTPTDEASAGAPPRPSFTPIVPMAEIQQTADAVVVPARVPRMTLAQYGLPLDPARADLPVDAELLVRRDGAVLAYRFVDY